MDEAVNPAAWGDAPAGAEAAASPAAWGDKPAEEPRSSLTQAAINLGTRFWDTFTEGGVSKFLKETLPGELGTRYHDVREAEAEFKANDEWNRERERRIAAGESVNGMEDWKLQRLNEIIAAKKQSAPMPSMSEIWEGVKSQAVNDPGGFAGKMARGLIAHPELLLTPEALPARMAEIGGRVAQVGTEAVQIGAAAAAESALAQLNERGQVNPAQTAMDAAMTAAPVVALRLAADLAVARNAKVRNIEADPNLAKEAASSAEAKVASGTPLDQALKESLDAIKIDPDVAAQAADMVKPHVAEAPKVEAVATEVPALLKPMTEVVPRAEMAQAGKVDPKLLAAMGLTGLGGAAGYLLNHDPKDAILGALATGGTIAAGALLARGVRGASDVLGNLRDTRFRITDVTDQYSGSIEGARLANMRLAEQIKTLVPKAADRERLTHYLQGTNTDPLTPAMQQAASAVQQFFERVGEQGKKAGILPDELLSNYVTQLWTGLNKNDSLTRNLMQSLGLKNLAASPGMAPFSRFSMKRVIPSYAEGMSKGMIPVTTDIADIMRVYGDNVAKAIANKNLVATLERTSTPWGEKLLVKDTPDASVRAIAQASAIVDREFQGGGEIGQAVRDFAIRKAPEGYVTVDHPQMRGYKVHEDIAPVMRNLFDAKPNALTNAAYGVSVAAKRGLFSYSMFHVKSLVDALAGTGADAWLRVLNGDAWNQLKRGAAGDAIDDLVRGGLKVVERPLEGDVTPFTNALKLIEERHPIIGAPAKGLLAVQKVMDGFLWGIVHPTFKSAVGLSALEKIMQRNPQMPRAQAAKMAASYTNDIFGGLDWFRIADGVQNRFGRDLALAVTSPRGRQFMQIMMLAPDWTVATTRAMAKAIPGISSREISALHQGYVVRSALLYATIADGLNLAFSGHHFWENKDPTMVDMGDGRRMQLSKHFMEPIHWLTSPAQQAWNKLGYVIKEPLEQMGNKEYLSLKRGSIEGPPITNKEDSTIAALGKRIGHAIAAISPITGQTAFSQGVVPALSGFFGAPIYGKTEQQAIEAARERATERGKNPTAAEQRVRRMRQKEREEQRARE